MRGFALTLLLTLLAPVAFASTIKGTVFDAIAKQPLANVTVAVSGTDIDGAITTTTDVEGNYQLTNLAPGTFTLKFTAASHRDFTRTDIPLKLDQTIRVNVELLPAE
jgi:hypothetical protein